MANTFGVTHTAFAYRFSGQTFSDWAPQISHWVEMAASELAVVLRQQGRESGDVPGASDLYALCARYIEHAVMVDIARAQTRQDPEIAQAAMRERDRIADLIRSHQESLIRDDFDRNTMLGSFRSGGRRGRQWGGGTW
jgi:hypothetical protein